MKRYSLRRAISEEGGSTPDLFSSQEASELKKISDVFEELIKTANNVTLQVLFEVVIREAGILNYHYQFSRQGLVNGGYYLPV